MTVMTDKEKKQLEKEQKVEAKIVDELDVNFCGFTQLSIVDIDGYPKQIKGSGIAGALFLSRTNGKITIESSFAPNPLYFMKVERDSNMFLTGELWFGEAKKSPLNLIGKIVPKSCEQCVNVMEKTKAEEFQLKVEIPFLKDSPNRLAMLTVVTKEEKFVTKILKISLELADADWMEWKQYRMKFWRSSKAWGASPPAEDDKDEKDKDKKDDDTEMKD